jgi:hypothetical protein
VEVSTTNKVPDAGPDNGNPGLESVSANNSRDCIGGIVKAVHEFERQREAERKNQKKRVGGA